MFMCMYRYILPVVCFLLFLILCRGFQEKSYACFSEISEIFRLIYVFQQEFLLVYLNSKKYQYHLSDVMFYISLLQENCNTCM